MNKIHKLHNVLKVKFIKRTINHNPKGFILVIHGRKIYQNNILLQYFKKEEFIDKKLLRFCITVKIKKKG